QFVSRSELSRRLATAEEDVARLLLHSDSRTQSTGRARVVLAGLPNAGKSTLFNALAGRDAALVSAEAGTTRDYLHATLVGSGIAVELVDTAGWESAGFDVASELPPQEGSIPQAAQWLRESQWEEADLIVWCTPCDQTPAARLREREILDKLKRDGRRVL